MLLFLAVLMLFLTFNRHSRTGYFNYHSELWSDKAGYYVYLPMIFNYSFDARNCPDSIVQKTGRGFKITEDYKIVTKYTYGVALMQLPVYLTGELIMKIQGVESTGFNPISHSMINIAAVIYLLIGIYFLFGSLILLSINRFISIFTVFVILFGTNLFYYSIDETGMSHVYSFALFSVLLNKFVVPLISGKPKGSFILISIISAIVILIRPTNAIFIAGALLLLPKKEFFKYSFSVGIMFFLLVIPQLIYWQYAFDGFTMFSYKGEGFNFLNPQILTSLLAPNNGLFLYTPLFVLILISILYSIKQQSLKKYGRFSVIILLIITYVFSSWWLPGFGCSFGGRNYVEYLSLFSIPLAFYSQNMLSKNTSIKMAYFSVLVLLVLFNLKLTYTFDECFMGVSEWDWNEYIRLVTASPK